MSWKALQGAAPPEAKLILNMQCDKHWNETRNLKSLKIPAPQESKDQWQSLMGFLGIDPIPGYFSAVL